ncbi:hypothetical protein B0H14DRAFT_2355245 [Mycena olivaceomarginata]|nr:hypothetical protein B0H14DRAFT_2355245 [Mycena olivaceomarginata]
MLYFALEYKRPIKEFTSDQEHGLRTFELTSVEWKPIQQLADILKILKDATLFFSRHTSNLARVIPVMDKIHEDLTKAAVKSDDIAITTAIHTALKTLNRYYSLSDNWEARSSSLRVRRTIYFFMRTSRKFSHVVFW